MDLECKREIRSGLRPQKLWGLLYLINLVNPSAKNDFLIELIPSFQE
jgi:hypothetical protein